MPPGDVTEPRPRPVGSVLLALAVVVFVVLGGLAIAAFLDPSQPAANAAIGDCVRAPDMDQVTRIEIVDCDRPHEFEVIGTVDLGEGPFPGDDGGFRQALEACKPVYEAHLGAPYPQPPWWLNVFSPSGEGWEEGDRTATCLLFQYTEDREDFATIEGRAPNPL